MARPGRLEHRSAPLLCERHEFARERVSVRAFRYRGRLSHGCRPTPAKKGGERHLQEPSAGGLLLHEPVSCGAALMTGVSSRLGTLPNWLCAEHRKVLKRST